MAGGSGTRFWPLSRRDHPKQFLAIVGEHSMLRQTWERCSRVVGDPGRVIVVTAAAYAGLTRQQLPDLAEENLLLEPQARNTAPCLAWAAAVLQRRDPDAVMAVFPADHVIHDVEGLRLSTTAARAAAARGLLVTFGVPPRYPETGYGYVELAAPLENLPGASGVPVHQVRGFREKPDLEVAKGFVAAGNFMWNSGMFVWRCDAFNEALQRHEPRALSGAEAMLAAHDTPEREAAYREMPATSIDYAVLERAENVACVRAQFDWSDVGSWEALQELLEGDQDGNVARGDVVTLDARSNLVHAPG